MKTPAPDLTSDTDLGCLVALARYMKVPLHYLADVKKGSILRFQRDGATNPPCFTGTKSCKKWVMEWLERNRDFKTTEVDRPRSLQRTA